MNYLFRLIGLVVYYLTFILPRKKNRWVFGEAYGFNNNSKYLFIEVIEIHPEIEAVWIGRPSTISHIRKINLPAYSKYSLKGIYYCLTAKVYIVSSTPGDINFYASGGAFIVNLWHGVGWKACLWSNPIHKQIKNLSTIIKFRHLLRTPHLYYKPNLILSTSKYFTTNFFAPMFDVKIEAFIEAIYPRCKFILKDHVNIIHFIQKYEGEIYKPILELIKNYERVILYAPTFRDNKEDFIKTSGISFNELNEIMVEKNQLFIIKLHPSTNWNKKVLDGYSNILYLDTSFDLYLLLPFIDILISDYSSIIFDYLLLKKKIILYVFDIDRYISSSRTFALDYNILLPGIPRIKSFEGLKNALFHDNLFTVDDNLVKMYWNLDNKDIICEITKRYETTRIK